MSKKVDMINIIKLNEFSHLIEGKIEINFNHEAILATKRRKNSYFNFYSILIENTNFIKICDTSRFNYHIFSYKEFRKNEDIISLLEIIRKVHHDIMFDKSKFKLSYANFYSRDLDIEVIMELFLLYKEHRYHFNENSFYFMRKNKIDYARKIISMYIETILDIKYREDKNYFYQLKIAYSEFKGFRKIKRHFKLHNIRFKNLS